MTYELMWAHYANQFTGICVAYSLSRLLKSLLVDINFVRMYYDEMVPSLLTMVEYMLPFK